MTTETEALNEILTAAATDKVTSVADALVTVVTPPESARHLLDLQELEPTPARTRAALKAHTAESFADLTARFVTSGAHVYVDRPAQKLEAILNDDHPANGPDWRDHRVVLDLRQTPEWVFWTANQGLGEQQKFAEVIEDGLEEIVSPSAADMLELAQSFQASISSKFSQQGRLTNGAVQFTYAEDINATAGANGTLEIPSEFKIRLAVYYGSAEVDLVARLRYRLKAGALTIGYQLVHPERAVLDAFESIVESALDRLDSPAVVEGVAPQPAATPGVGVIDVQHA